MNSEQTGTCNPVRRENEHTNAQCGQNHSDNSPKDDSALPFGRLWYTKSDDAISYAELFSRSHDAVIRVYDAAGNVIETHEHTGDFKEP